MKNTIIIIIKLSTFLQIYYSIIYKYIYLLQKEKSLHRDDDHQLSPYYYYYYYYHYYYYYYHYYYYYFY